MSRASGSGLPVSSLATITLVSLIEVPAYLNVFDLLVMLAATLSLVVTASTSRQVSRWEGCGPLVADAAFTNVRAKIAL